MEKGSSSSPIIVLAANPCEQTGKQKIRKCLRAVGTHPASTTTDITYSYH
jgi:hypothetical protein